jgi:hypothetical protein
MRLPRACDGGRPLRHRLAWASRPRGRRRWTFGRAAKQKLGVARLAQQPPPIIPTVAACARRTFRGTRVVARPNALSGSAEQVVEHIEERMAAPRRRGRPVGVEPQLAVVLQRDGGRAVARRRRADDDGRGRLLARGADGGPVGGPHGRDGRLRRRERRADEHVDDRGLPRGWATRSTTGCRCGG